MRPSIECISSVTFVVRQMRPHWLNRRRALGFLSLVFTGIAIAGPSDSQITVGFFELPPHAFIKSGKPSGAAIEYFNLIAKEMGVRVTYIQYPLARLLNTSTVDTILLMGKTAEREAKFVYPSLPLMRMEGSLTVRTDSPLKNITRNKDLEGLNIGVYDAGYRGSIMNDPQLTLYKIPGETLISRGLQMVKLKHIDAFYSPEVYSVAKAIKEARLELELRSVKLPPSNDLLYSAFSRSAAPKYLERFESAVGKLQKRTPYVQFLNSYLAHATQ